SAWPDGGEVPQKHAGRGGNVSPAFEFNWDQGGNSAMPPATLMSYVIIFHDIENAPRGGETTTNVGRGGYFGPGAGPGPFHHYVFEFYALDKKLDLPNTSTRAQVLAAIDGHVVGKAAFVGRFHQ